MPELLKKMIALSVMTGALMHVCPEGGVKRVASVLCTAVLSLAVLSHLGGMDRELYTLENAKLGTSESRIEQNGAAAGQELNRRYLQEEYTDYIVQQAGILGISELSADVQMQRSLDGLWLPYAAELSGPLEPWQREALEKVLDENLGIPPERQVWNEYGAEE